MMWAFHQTCGKKTHWYGHMSKVSKGNFPVVIWHGSMAVEVRSPEAQKFRKVDSHQSGPVPTNHQKVGKQVAKIWYKHVKAINVADSKF